MTRLSNCMGKPLILDQTERKQKEDNDSITGPYASTFKNFYYHNTVVWKSKGQDVIRAMKHSPTTTMDKLEYNWKTKA